MTELLIVDQFGRAIFDPSTEDVAGRGLRTPIGRLVWALPLTVGTSALRRYQPSHPPGETCVFGMDFSALTPRWSILTMATLAIFTNTAVPASADSDWTVALAPAIWSRQVFVTLSGGVAGKDYRLIFTATDSDLNVWPRTGLILCSNMS